MLKKTGIVFATAAAGLFVFGGMASAGTDHDHHGHHSHHGHNSHHQGGRDGEWNQFGQVGLVNLNNTDLLHNVNATLGLCGNNINVLGIQVPIQHSLNGIGVPILSPGASEASGESPYNCASGAIVDGGTVQHN